MDLRVSGIAPDSTRERIVNCAGRLLAERGFRATSMRDIAKAAGITAGAVYKHFSSKADLLLEVVNRAVRSVPGYVQDGSGDDVTTALPRLAAAYTEPELKRLRQLTIQVASASMTNRRIKAVLTRSVEGTVCAIGAGVASAQRAGKLDPTLDPALVAQFLSLLLMGLTHLETLHPNLVGDVRWREFVQERVARLIGVA